MFARTSKNQPEIPLAESQPEKSVDWTSAEKKSVSYSLWQKKIGAGV